MRLFYSPEYTLASYSFDTTRKPTWIAESLVEQPISNVRVEAPEPLTVEHLLKAHSREYIDAVRTGDPEHLAESQGFTWDVHMFKMESFSNGGALSAARAALEEGVSGSLSTGLHHAKHGFGSGFCTFNGLAIAAKTLLDEGAVKSVLVLDLDAHCGGGTASLIKDEPRICQIDVSVNQYDRYSGRDNTRGRLVFDAAEYLPTVTRLLKLCTSSFDLVLYNAGMDPHEHCEIGGLNGITTEMLAERERLVFEHCRTLGIPIAFVLSGGYIGAYLRRNKLVDLHRLTIVEAAKVSVDIGKSKC